MTIFRVVVVAAGILGAVSVADIPSSTLHAEEGAIVAGDTATPAADQIEPVAQKRVGAVVPGKKKKKKASVRSKTLRNLPPEASEVIPPGKRLSSEELMALLRTSRDLSGKNLSGLNLVGVNLSKCNLKGADLRNADLERADLEESNLERANLSGANLKMVSLRLSGMIGANLEKAILDGAIWQDGRICAKGSVGMCLDAASPHSAK